MLLDSPSELRLLLRPRLVSTGQGDSLEELDVRELETGALASVSDPALTTGQTAYWLNREATDPVVFPTVIAALGGGRWFAFAPGAGGSGDVAVINIVGRLANEGLRAVVGTPGAAVVVRGYDAPGDDGGDTFVWVTTSAPNNDGTVIVPGVAYGANTAGAHWSRVLSGPPTCLMWGAKRDGVTVTTAEIVRALEAVDELWFPQGTYLTGQIDLLRKRIIGEQGATLIPSANNTTIINFVRDTSRVGQRGISGMRFANPASRTGCVAITDNAALDNEVDNVFVSGYAKGLLLIGSMQLQVSALAQLCTVGVQLESHPTDGGANANTLEVRAQECAVGVLIRNPGGFPITSNLFTGGMAQGCTTAGIAVAGDQITQVVFDSLHYEANGSGGPITVDGVTVQPCDLSVDGESTVTVRNSQFASGTASSCLRLRNGAKVFGEDVSGSASQSTALVDCDALSEYSARGGVSLFSSWKGAEAMDGVVSNAAGIFSQYGRAYVVWDESQPNDYTSDPFVVSLANVIGVASTAEVKDAQMGLTSQVGFAASAGNAGNNRLFMATFSGAPVVGQLNIVSFLIKTLTDSSITAFMSRGGTSPLVVVPTKANEWQRVTLSLEALNVTDGGVFLYPTNADGPTMRVSALCSQQTADPRSASRVIRGHIRPRVNRSRASAAAPTAGTWAVGDLVWNTTPVAGGTVGWVCTAAGTPGTWKTFGAIAP